MTTRFDRAHEHLNAMNRRSPIEAVHTRLLLGQILDICAAQAEDLAQLRAEVRSLQAARAHPTPYASALPWLGAPAAETLA